MSNFNDLNDSYKNMIIDLKVISKLKVSNKLNTTKKNLIIDDNYKLLQPFVRYYRQDNKELTYNKIKSLIKDVQQFMENIEVDYVTLKYDSSDELYKELLLVLEESKTGLLNLRETYETDTTFVPQLDIEISSLIRIIKKLKNKLNITENLNNEIDL
jgi:hypothetical protein